MFITISSTVISEFVIDRKSDVLDSRKADIERCKRKK